MASAGPSGAGVTPDPPHQARPHRAKRGKPPAEAARAARRATRAECRRVAEEPRRVRTPRAPGGWQSRSGGKCQACSRAAEPGGSALLKRIRCCRWPAMLERGEPRTAPVAQEILRTIPSALATVIPKRCTVVSLLADRPSAIGVSHCSTDNPPFIANRKRYRLPT